MKIKVGGFVRHVVLKLRSCTSPRKVAGHWHSPAVTTKSFVSYTDCRPTMGGMILVGLLSLVVPEFYSANPSL